MIRRCAPNIAPTSPLSCSWIMIRSASNAPSCLAVAASGDAHALDSTRARLSYRGDFDWQGIAIGNLVMREFSARPWRYTAADYVPRGSLPLQGSKVIATWDPALSDTMEAAGTAVHEEAMACSLLADLGAA